MKDSYTWQIGPNLEFELTSGKGVTTPDGKNFLIVGGQKDWATFLDTIYMLKCFEHFTDCSWNLMDQRLPRSRTSAVAMLIPESLANCS